ncbi:hypothetical protein Pla52n_37160 [Stieleria varia]|uniref:Uncharacterized protein n=1 Tax=Stieleria varia TaxID=2528005 RepID=A0A5C6ATX8_9BACT|nr:hypothetical protein Pla52n_37160 [Stieleria varia]
MPSSLEEMTARLKAFCGEWFFGGANWFSDRFWAALPPHPPAPLPQFLTRLRLARNWGRGEPFSVDVYDSDGRTTMEDEVGTLQSPGR